MVHGLQDTRMPVSRLTHITLIGVEQMGALADQMSDPHVLRLENLAGLQILELAQSAYSS